MLLDKSSELSHQMPDQMFDEIQNRQRKETHLFHTA